MGDPILAIDQGTTGTTCLVVDVSPAGFQPIGKGYAEFPQHFPEPGWVEHDLDEIWTSVLTATKEALAAAGVSGDSLRAIGITNQRETTGVWRRDGRPLHHAIVWQDRRTADRCNALAAAGHADLFRRKTGLVLDPYFAGTKLAWLLDEVPALRTRAAAGDVCFGTIDSWLVWKLTSGDKHVTDATNASRTLFYDIVENRWSPELAELLGGIPAEMLPEVRDSSGLFGETRGVGILPDGIPIAGIAGDQQAALFGQACFEPGMAKCTYGTGAFALVNTGSEARVSESGLVTTIAWRIDGKTTYAIEGSTFVAGAIVQWLRDGLGFIPSSADVEELAASVADTGGVVLVPALTGLGAPHWRPEARGLLCGLTRGTTRAHIARAALEGIAFQIGDLLAAMRSDSGAEVSLLRVDGGAAANDLLMQFQADLLGVEIHRPTNLETTALGAAGLAALAVGSYSGLSDMQSAWQREASFTPQMDAEHVAAHMERWRAAVSKA